MKKIIKKSLIINWLLFFFGNLYYKLFGRTPKVSYMAMINLYCITNGEFLENFNKKNVFSDTLNARSKNFKNFTSKDIQRVVEEIKSDGYKVFEHKLASKTVNELKSLSYSLKADVAGNKIFFDPKNKKSNIYIFNSSDLIQNKYIQDLIMDPFLIKIAGNYLGANPIFDFATMWWSTDSKIKKEDAAQEYHFDLDRLKWLKVFIYLTDVSNENGPHCYILGTHKAGSKPQEILNRGYVRVEDKELKKYYPQNNFKEIIGPAGTIVFGDTRSWHKGKPIIKGDRLIIQLEYTSSLFGSNYPKVKINNPSPKFSKFCRQNKFYSKNIQLNS